MTLEAYNLFNFPDGKYYVNSDFKTTEIIFQGGMPITKTPIEKEFKKGEAVEVITMIVDSSLQKQKAIKTPTGNFNVNYFVNNLSKTKPTETIVSENISTEISTEAKEKNENKLIIMVIGAFVLGYLLSKE